MKRRTKDTATSLTRALFAVIGIGTLVTAAALLSQGRSAPKLFSCFSKYTVWRIRQALRELKVRGLIKYDEEDERSPIILSERGMVRRAKEDLRNVRGKKWDHLWRIILFDIPCTRRSRTAFQMMLKRIGCYRLQLSVYVHPHECKEDILKVAQSYGLKSYVDVLTVPHLGRKERAARKFYFERFTGTKSRRKLQKM